MRCRHFPVDSRGRSYGQVAGHRPWVNGERTTCSGCGQTIRFVEGYDLRRDYWTVVPRARSAAAF